MATTSRIRKRFLAVNLALCKVLDVDPDEVILIDQLPGEGVVEVRYLDGRIDRRTFTPELARSLADAERDAIRAHEAQFTSTVGALTAADHNRTITVTTSDGVRITGPLRALHVTADMIPVQDLMSEQPDMIPGARSVDIAIGSWEAHGLDPETPVRFAS